eukprot:587335-Rhodomonas_salina.2
MEGRKWMREKKGRGKAREEEARRETQRRRKAHSDDDGVVMEQLFQQLCEAFFRFHRCRVREF